MDRTTEHLKTLLQELLQQRKVTGSLRVVERELKALGFEVELVTFGETANLWATRKAPKEAPLLCFLGHADVVPAGEGWTVDPFRGMCSSEVLFGRGAVDMKGSIACFLEALRMELPPKWNVSVLISGDEEGDGTHGTPALLEHLRQQGQLPDWDFVLIGEPTGHLQVGDHIKVGSRGSLNVTVRAQGKGGHVAYPEHLESPLRALVGFCDRLLQIHWDEEDPVFGSTHVELTELNGGGQACNLVPSVAQAGFNIRFTPQVNFDQLTQRIRQVAAQNASVEWDFDFDLQSTPRRSDSPILGILKKAVEAVTHQVPVLTARGASSDARFLPADVAFAELGLRTKGAHAPNESVSLRDLERLTQIYKAFMKPFLRDFRRKYSSSSD